MNPSVNSMLSPQAPSKKDNLNLLADQSGVFIAALEPVRLFSKVESELTE
jgi:hypothetical protein